MSFLLQSQRNIFHAGVISSRIRGGYCKANFSIIFTSQISARVCFLRRCAWAPSMIPADVRVPCPRVGRHHHPRINNNNTIRANRTTVRVATRSADPSQTKRHTLCDLNVNQPLSFKNGWGMKSDVCTTSTRNERKKKKINTRREVVRDSHHDRGTYARVPVCPGRVLPVLRVPMASVRA
jgi:hypothetical protein